MTLYTGVEKVVLSQSAVKTLSKNYIVANSPNEAIEKLSKKGLKNILVAGGATTNSAFAKESLFDEIILNVEPVFIGRGTPLFAEKDFDLKAELTSSEKNGGLLTLHYRVLK